MKKTLTQLLMDLSKYDRRLYYLTKYSPATLARLGIHIDEKGYLTDADKTRRTDI